MSCSNPGSIGRDEERQLLGASHAFGPRHRGPGCPCCGSEYRQRGCTFDYGCSCKYSRVCPDYVQARQARFVDEAIDRESIKKILDEPLRHGEKCVTHCGHAEHHPMYEGVMNQMLWVAQNTSPAQQGVQEGW